MAWPAKPPGEQLSEVLLVRLTTKDATNIARISKALGMNKTQWARQTILEALSPPK